MCSDFRNAFALLRKGLAMVHHVNIWGYHHFRKPPYVLYVCMYTVKRIGAGFLDPATFHFKRGDAWRHQVTLSQNSGVFQFHDLSIGWQTAEI